MITISKRGRVGHHGQVTAGMRGADCQTERAQRTWPAWDFCPACNPDLAQTLTSQSYHSHVSALSVSHTPQVAAMIAAEQSAAVFWFDCCTQNLNNSQQFNILRKNSERNHILMISSIWFTILVKFDCRFGKIKNVVHTAVFTVTHSMSSKTHLLTNLNTVWNRWHVASTECPCQVW